MRVSRYHNYSASGIPAHWSERALGSVVTRVSERGQPQLAMLSVLRERGVVLRSELTREENRNFLPDDLSNYQVVRAGNLVVNKMKAWQGSFGVSRYDGLVSPAYYVFRVRFDHAPYLHVLLRSKPWVDLFARASDGVRIGQWDLSYERMKRIPVLVPPEDEQQAITRFLAWSEAKMQRLISVYRRLVGISKSVAERKSSLLFEYRTRLVADVVTGKLDVRDAAATLPTFDEFDEGGVEEELSDEVAIAED